ncbi:helix-turn-helix domain-containing protein [uncultured Amphritea sp.]|uniref:helix-turn-helix domain-containing protein n=1 Tax=uncultured Amphritea sp. TaxID=981605 RepID=UPI002628A9EC|nr:helix-turn-helix domain-containing protein [uncultured Amphritea sp.]
MNNWKRPPCDLEIARYIDCYWYLEKTPGDNSYSHPKLNPSPEAHLLLAPTEQPYHYTLNGVEKKGYGGHLLLPNTGTIDVHHLDPFLIIGIKFKAGALYSLAQTADFPMLDDIINLSDFLAATTLTLPPEPSTATRSDAINELRIKLDNWLHPLLKNVYQDRYCQLTEKAAAIFEHTELADLAQNLHCSRRTLERAFRRVTGLSLKQYEAMRTLDKLLYYLYQYQDRSPDWADVAAKFGFSDQPHLIRYLKTAISSTPGNYLKQRDLTIDVYGDFE